MERFTTYHPSLMQQPANAEFAPDFQSNAHPPLKLPADTVKNKQHNLPLFDAAEEWRIAFNAVPTPIFIHDKHYRIVRANKAYIELAKMALEDIIGQYYWQVFPKRNGPFSCCRGQKERHGEAAEELFSQPGMVFKTRSYAVPNSTEEDPHTLHILENVTVELERRRRLHFLECIDQINLAIHSDGSMQENLERVLNTVLNIFDCDRVFLITPCDPDANNLTCPMEVSKPAYPGLKSGLRELTITPEVAHNFELLLSNPEKAVRFDPNSRHQVSVDMRENHHIQSMLCMSIFPQKSTAWEFGLVQCSKARVWKEDEVTLFEEIGHRLRDSLTSLIISNELQSALEVVESSHTMIFRWLPGDHWPVEYISQNVFNILGYQPEVLISGQLNYADLIHPEDLPSLEKLASEYKQAQHDEMEFEYRLICQSGEVRWVKENTRAIRNSVNDITQYIGVVTDITEQKQTSLRIKHLNRTLRALSAGNEHLIHATDEKMLVQNMCRIIVEIGGYIMAWVGYAQDNEAKSIRPIAQFGNGHDYLTNVSMTWADNILGKGPTGRAVRTGKTQLLRDTTTDPNFAPWRDHAIKKGYHSVIAIPLINEGKIFGALTIDAENINAFDDEEIKLLEELANELAYGITHLRLGKLQRISNQQLHDSLVDTIRAISLTVEKRDPYTAGHQNRVADLCVAIAQELGLPKKQIEGLRLGAMIHDIGKICIPAEVLNRPGKLSQPEFDLIKSHPEIGFDIIKDITFPWPIGNMVLQHHERLDGSGYPYGLKADEIDFSAKILAVADIVEAMSAHRPYRPSLGSPQALDEIQKQRDIKLDAEVVDACLRLFNEKNYEFDLTF